MSSKTDGQAVFRLRIHAKASETETTYDADGQTFKLIFILAQDKKKRDARKGDLLARYPAFNRFLSSIASDRSYPAGNTFSAPSVFTP